MSIKISGLAPTGIRTTITPPPPAYIMPVFVANGAPVLGSGNAKDVYVPAGIQSGDLLVLFAANNNDPALTAPAGWVRMAGTPVGSGSEGSSGSSGLSIFYKISNGTETFVTMVPTTSYAHGYGISAFRNVNVSTPITVIGTSVRTSGTAVTFPSVTTTYESSLIVNAVSSSADTGAPQYSGWTNASLTDVTERWDVNSSINTGVGFAFATGGLAVAGSSGITTATAAGSGTSGNITFAINPIST